MSLFDLWVVSHVYHAYSLLDLGLKELGYTLNQQLNQRLKKLSKYFISGPHIQ
jgi:hypothetical protein